MQKKKILVVEDEQQMANLVKTELENAGYDIILAFDGMEGLQKAREGEFDLIILDLMLPKLDGYQICRMLKFDKKSENIPIIMLTALGQEENKNMGKEVGADCYFTKPFKPKELLAKIEALLAKKG